MPPGVSTKLRQTLDSGPKESNCNNKSLSVLESSKGFGCEGTTPPGLQRPPPTPCQDKEIEKDGWMERKKEI